jgi:uncharacterized membrane protein SpoIIM required for sporulation
MMRVLKNIFTMQSINITFHLLFLSTFLVPRFLFYFLFFFPSRFSKQSQEVPDLWEKTTLMPLLDFVKEN